MIDGLWQLMGWIEIFHQFRKPFLLRLVGGFSPTHLKNMLVKSDHSPQAKVKITDIWNYHLEEIWHNELQWLKLYCFCFFFSGGKCHRILSNFTEIVCQLRTGMSIIDRYHMAPEWSMKHTGRLLDGLGRPLRVWMLLLNCWCMQGQFRE